MVLGQGFSYTFTDPCTFKQKQIYIDNPSGSVLLSYNGSTQSFTQLQLQSGSLEQWINQVNSTNPDGPCSGVGLAQNTNMNVLITQNNIAVMTNVMSALNDISSIGGTSIGGIVEAKEKSSSEDNKRKNNIISHHLNEEEKLLTTLATEIAAEFDLLKSDVELFMETFDGTTRQLYIHYLYQSKGKSISLE